MYQKELYSSSEIINLTKKTNITHYTPVIWGLMNGRLYKANFNLICILLYYGARSFIILGKHMQIFWKKNTKQVRWSTQGGDFNTKYTSKVENVMPGIDVKTIVIWNFHVGGWQITHRYDMILGRNIFYGLNINLCLPYNIIRVNIVSCIGCTSPMKNVSRINFESSSSWIE